MSEMDPTKMVVEAVIKGAISEGLKVGTGGVKAAWSKLKDLVGKWSGNRKDKVDDALGQVVSDPDSKGRQLTLSEELEKIEECAGEELVTAAKEFVEATKADEETTQSISNLYQSAAANASGGGDATATVNIGGEKKTPGS